MIFYYLTFTCVPYINFSICSSWCYQPRDISAKLYCKQFLFEIFTLYFEGICSSIIWYVPDFHIPISACWHHHWRNVRRETNLGACWFMSLQCKYRRLNFPWVIAKYLTTFGWNCKVVLKRSVPSSRLNIAGRLWKFGSYTATWISYIYNIYSSIISCCKQCFIAFIIPFYCLYFFFVMI